MKILALDSSATAASAALLEDDVILGEFFINTKLTHSQTLMPMVDALLKNTCVSIEGIDAFAVSAGPGSFTGIRIGVAAVKGMAMAANKPCVSVSTLEAIAYNLTGVNGIACAVMDARCQQVYNALFESENGIVRRITPDRAIAIEQLRIELCNQKKPIFFVGDGAQLCYNKIRCDLPAVQCAPPHLLYQRASGVARAAVDVLKHGQALSAAQLMPVYLRLPQAERELKQQLNKNGAAH